MCGQRTTTGLASMGKEAVERSSVGPVSLSTKKRMTSVLAAEGVL